jgi:hypothetical protein
VYRDARGTRRREEGLGARARLLGALALRCEHDPVDLEVGNSPGQRQERPAAADLDVIRVAADRENPVQRPGG